VEKITANIQTLMKTEKPISTKDIAVHFADGACQIKSDNPTKAEGTVKNILTMPCRRSFPKIRARIVPRLLLG
jgi:hypothetical protein